MSFFTTCNLNYSYYVSRTVIQRGLHRQAVLSAPVVAMREPNWCQWHWITITMPATDLGAKGGSKSWTDTLQHCTTLSMYPWPTGRVSYWGTLIDGRRIAVLVSSSIELAVFPEQVIGDIMEHTSWLSLGKWWCERERESKVVGLWPEHMSHSFLSSPTCSRPARPRLVVLSLVRSVC